MPTLLVEGIYAVLVANASMQEALGSVASRTDSTTGIFPGLAPDEVPMPYIVYQQIAGQPLQQSMQGTGALTTARLRFSCYGTTYKQAKELGKVLNQVMISITVRCRMAKQKCTACGYGWMRTIPADSTRNVVCQPSGLRD